MSRIPISPVTVFRDLSITIDTAWRTGGVGKNGSGKTTLLKLISGRLPAAKGGVITIRKGNHSQWEKNEELEGLFARRQQERLRREIAELERAARNEEGLGREEGA